jgi:hypothetical protein
MIQGRTLRKLAFSGVWIALMIVSISGIVLRQVQPRIEHSFGAGGFVWLTFASLLAVHLGAAYLGVRL